MDNGAFNYLKELKINKDKCDEIFKKYKIKDFKELEERLNKGETLADIRYVFIGGRACGKNEKVRIAKKLKAFEIIENHKLLNYVLKNPKCAAMYGLSEQDIQALKEALPNE